MPMPFSNYLEKTNNPPISKDKISLKITFSNKIQEWFDGRIFHHFSGKQNGEMTIKSDAFGPRNVLSAIENIPTKMTPCARVVF